MLGEFSLQKVCTFFGLQRLRPLSDRLDRELHFYCLLDKNFIVDVDINRCFRILLIKI